MTEADTMVFVVDRDALLDRLKPGRLIPEPLVL
jgi:hypothetical protein